MDSSLFERVVLPLASVDDARATCRAVEPYLTDGSSVVAVHVVEKAGGGIDKASVEQREENAERIFETVTERLGGRDVSTDVLYGTDVAEAILDRAAEIDASVIAFTPREAGRLVRLLTGDTAMSLVDDTDRPLLVLPEADDGA